MQPKSVLLLSPFIYPEPISTGKYNTELAKEFVSRGISVTVIAFHPLYPDWQQVKSDDQLEGMAIYRGGSWISFPKSIIIRRILLELTFSIYAIKQLLKLHNSYDVIISVFPPSLLFYIINFFLQKHARKVGIIHDLQGVMANVVNSKLNWLAIKLIRILEEASFKCCGKLIFVSHSMARRAVCDYKLNKEDIEIHYPFVTLRKQKITNDLAKIFPIAFKHIVYSGALGEKQNPIILLKFFHALTAKRRDIKCHIFSRGPLFEELKQKQKGDGTYFHDLVSEKNLYELYLRSNVQIIPQKKETSEGAIPSKLPNIISAGVPIFAICDCESEVGKIIKDVGFGHAVHTWDIKILVDELIKFLDVSVLEIHKQRQERAKDYVKKNFQPSNIIKTIMEVC